MGSAGNAWILAYAERRNTALVWRVACDAFLEMLAGSGQRAKGEPRHPKGIVREDRERGVVGALCQAQQCLPNLARGVQLWPCVIKPPQAMQDRDQLGCLAHLLTQGVCLGVGVLHLGRCKPFRYL